MEIVMSAFRRHPTSLTVSPSFSKERRRIIQILLGAAAANGGLSAAPTPGVEGPKQVAIGLADVLVFSGIYQAYFDKELDEQSLQSLLMDTGVAVAVGGGFAYVSIKLGESVLAEILNFVPIVGWLVSGAITASMTVTFGVLWAWACERSIRNGTSPAAEMRAQMRGATA
jgi:uncharacterized protein (DUF697 family)